MTNFPKVGKSPVANLINRVVFRLMDTLPGYSQLFPISTLGVDPGEPVVTPDLPLLRSSAGTPRVDARDFRDEIRIRIYPGGRLVYDSLVKDFGDADRMRLGILTFTEDVVSERSDKRLHVWIPRDLPCLTKPV